MLTFALTGALQTLRPYVRRVVPARLHHAAGHFGRWAVRSLEARQADVPIGRPPRLPLSPASQGPIVMVNAALAAGGAERQIVNLLLGLAARGVPVALVTLNLEERSELRFFYDQLTGAGIEVRNALPVAAAANLLTVNCGKSAMADLRAGLDWAPIDVRDDIIRLAAEFVALRPRIVHGWQDATSIAASFAGLATGVPRIIAAGRNLHPEHFSHARPFMRTAYAYLEGHDEVILTNNSVAGAVSYSEWLGLPVERIEVVRNGIDARAIARPDALAIAEFRQRLGLPARARLVGGAFRLQAEKQPELWIEVAARVADELPDVHFVIMGEGTMRNTVRREARRLGIADRLHMPGTVADMARGLAMLEVLLLTSAQEGTPNVLLEATCLGVPVVVTDAGGTREAVLEGRTGYVIDQTGLPKDAIADTAASAVIRAMGGGIEPGRLAIEGPRFIEEAFGLDRMVEEMMALYGTAH